MVDQDRETLIGKRIIMWTLDASSEFVRTLSGPQIALLYVTSGKQVRVSRWKAVSQLKLENRTPFWFFENHGVD